MLKFHEKELIADLQIMNNIIVNLVCPDTSNVLNIDFPSYFMQLL